MLYSLVRWIMWGAIVFGLLQLSDAADAQPIPNNIWLVDQDGGSDSNDGQGEWEDAFETLQKALEEAQSGHQIWVADGTYVPTVQIDVNFELDEVSNPCDSASRTYTFRLIPGVSMFGGFQGNSHPSGGETSLSEADPATYLTILSGELGSAGISDNAYHVLVYFRDADEEELDCETYSEPMIIDGFVITGGNASGGEQDPFTCTGEQRNGAGGGAFIEFWACDEVFPVGPRFSRCVFENNHARIAGGGIATKKAGTTILDCEFRENTQTENSPVNNMTAVSGGGAISSIGKTTVIRSRFFQNESAEAGGGVITLGPTKLINCEFRGNTAPVAGGASINGVVMNSLFAGNVASDGNGGGLVGGDVHVCTFVDNFAEGYGAGASDCLEVTNSLFWGNAWNGSPDQPHKGDLNVACATFQTTSSPPRNSIYNLIEHWTCPSGGASCCSGSGCGCLTVAPIGDPKFIDRDGPDNTIATVLDNNYRLSESSPAINVGDPALSASIGYFPPDEFDINNDSDTTELTPELDLADRIYADPGNALGATRIDVGAYEAPCFINEGCGVDCVTSSTLAPPRTARWMALISPI